MGHHVHKSTSIKKVRYVCGLSRSERLVSSYSRAALWGFPYSILFSSHHRVFSPCAFFCSFMFALLVFCRRDLMMMCLCTLSLLYTLRFRRKRDDLIRKNLSICGHVPYDNQAVKQHHTPVRHKCRVFYII